ncbi:hypothetical protein V492_03333 [Pseudogymnoascus sp. VKM F-4246]|nr:hypothetical protein V492_03333 [Pseudogymnoascus sp. VKM F-4246]
MPDSDKANLARIRDNQRRSRARRKEYLQELEGRVRQCELTGVEASSEIQGAARKVIEENRRLRLLLAQHGLSLDDHSDDDGNQQWAASTPKSDEAQALETLLSIQRWKCGETQGSPPETGSASTIPGERNIDMVASPPPTTQAAWMPSPESMEDQGAEQMENSGLGLDTLQTGWAASPDGMQYQGLQKLSGESDPCTPVSSYSFSSQCCGGNSCTSNPREQQAPPLQQQTQLHGGRMLGGINMLGPMSTHEEQRKAFDFAVQAQIDPNQYRYLQQLHALYDPSKALYDPTKSIFDPSMTAAFQQTQPRQIQLPVRPGPSFQTPPYTVGPPRSTPNTQAIGTNSCIYATDMITAIATDALPSDVRTDLGCSPQCGTDCEMANQSPHVVEPDDIRGAPDPRFATPFNRVFDVYKQMEAVKLYGTVAVLGPKPTFNSSTGNAQPPPDGPADDDYHEYEVDPWGRPRETLVREENPFADRNVTQGEHDDRRGTEVDEFPQFGNFGPYFRKVDTSNNFLPKHIAPHHKDGRYDITPFIDEELKKDPCELNPEFNDWRREVEFQFGERPPSPPPSLGPAPKPIDASYDFSSLTILLKNRNIQPLLVPHPSIRSPLAPQQGTDDEMDADYERINSMKLELCASWWIANILWFIGENDASLLRTIGMIREGSCPREVFPYEIHSDNMDRLDDYQYESEPLRLYEPFRVSEGRPDPIENSFWVPKLKYVNGSAMKSMRPPFPEACTLDTRYSPVTVLQSTVLPQRIDIKRPELKLWDGIPGHTFRLPPYFWPNELKDGHLEGYDQPFAVDIRRIPVNPRPGTVHPQPKSTFRPTRRLNIVCRDRTKVPQNPKRQYSPDRDTPTKVGQGTGENQLGDDSPDDGSLPPSFLQDEYEYGLVGDVWGPVGGFKGRDYDSERQKDQDGWYRYFLVNNDPWERTIVVNGVQVRPGAVAGPLPAFAIFELGDQAAFWFGVGGRSYDPNTTLTPEKAAAANKAVLGTTIIRTNSPGQETGGSVGASWVVQLPLVDLPSPATAATAVFSNLHIGQAPNQPVQQAPMGVLRPDAPEFVPGSLGGLERLGLRGGAGTEADLGSAGRGGGAAPPGAKRTAATAADENKRRIEAAMDEAARQKAAAYAAAGELLRGDTQQQESAGNQQGTTTAIPQVKTTAAPRPVGAPTPYKFTAVALPPPTAETPHYMSGETPPYMSTGALESRLERLGVCVDPSWDRKRLLNELLKVMTDNQSAHKAKRANTPTGVAQETVAERQARARAERMIAAVSENNELEQRHVCDGLGIVISPEWSPARIREEIARLYETAYQELSSHDDAVTEYESAMGMMIKHTPTVVEVLFWLAGRYMYRQRSAAGLRALCEKYGIKIYGTWSPERVIVEIMRAVEQQRQMGITRKVARDASMAASMATMAALETEIATVRASMSEMAKRAKAKTGPAVIDLTTPPGPVVIDII